MTAEAHNLVAIRCDTCDTVLEDGDQGIILWESRAEAAKWLDVDGDPEAVDRWEIPADSDGPDVCPVCICKRDGHIPDVLDVTSSRTGLPLVVCQRCSHFLPGNEFQEVPAAVVPVGTSEGMDELPGLEGL